VQPCSSQQRHRTDDHDGYEFGLAKRRDRGADEVELSSQADEHYGYTDPHHEHALLCFCRDHCPSDRGADIFFKLFC
jgi:hypothetical protein